jgi:hypothetical protein
MERVLGMEPLKSRRCSHVCDSFGTELRGNLPCVRKQTWPGDPTQPFR